METIMKSPTLSKALVIIFGCSLLTTILIQYKNVNATIKKISNKETEITQLLSYHTTKIKQKTSTSLLFNLLEKNYNGKIIQDKITPNKRHITIQTAPEDKPLITVINELKKHYLPINNIAIDLLNQTIELTLPLRK
jgi:hypothetical protein